MKAIISVIRTTEYCSIVEMTPEKFKQFQEELDGDPVARREAELNLNKLIDTKDWQDDQFDSLEDFQEFKEEKP